MSELVRKQARGWKGLHPLSQELYSKTYFKPEQSYEDALIDYLNPKDKEKFKTYVRFQANSALLELGMKANWLDVKTNPFEFMELLVGTIITDFFSGKVTQYSKKMLGSRDELKEKLRRLNEERTSNE